MLPPVQVQALQERRHTRECQIHRANSTRRHICTHAHAHASVSLLGEEPSPPLEGVPHNLGLNSGPLKRCVGGCLHVCMHQVLSRAACGRGGTQVCKG